jgi:hypothetical protein
MTGLIAFLAVGALLVIVAAGTFLAIVVSIHRVDRSKRLTEEPRTFLDAATRRFLGAHSECRTSRATTTRR